MHTKTSIRGCLSCASLLPQNFDDRNMDPVWYFKTKIKCFPTNAIASKLDAAVLSKILGFHALTECDNILLLWNQQKVTLEDIFGITLIFTSSRERW